jgi:repressor LexA
MSPLTPKQKKVLDFIESYVAQHEYPPSQREISDAFGFRSLGTVQNYLVRLEREGVLVKDWNAQILLRCRPT